MTNWTRWIPYACPGTLLVLLAAASGELRADVRLNEVLFSNHFTSYDEDGDSSDWVELYNAGGTPVDLAGWGLSDDASWPHKWVFPDVELGAGDYLLVWSSGKDRVYPAPEAIVAVDSAVAFLPTLIDLDAEWRYVFGDASAAELELGLPVGWQERDFDDSSWSVGKPGFGFGDDDDVTVLPSDIGPVLLRHRFRVTARQLLEPLYFQADYDDGFVLFLNGRRILSVNFDEDAPLNFGAEARSSHEARGRPGRWDLSRHLDLLDTGGENVAAVVLLNRGVTSNDLSLLPELGTVPHTFHTNFQLSSAGEQLLLVTPEQVVADAVDVPAQSADRSYGRVRPGEGEFFYLLTPTPGAPNDSPFSASPISTRPSLRPEGGEYEDAVEVTIEASFPFDDFEIRYTLDGSPPNAGSRLYEEALDITRSRVVRAAVFRDGERISQTETMSYFLGAERYDLPILSISMSPADFSRVHNDSGARGRASEREGHVEVVTPAGGIAASVGMGLRLHGGAGRNGAANIKKAYKMYFRGVYGAPKLEYGLIPETDVAIFDKVVLRSNFNDGFRTGQEAALIRDEVIRDLHEDMGGVVSHGAWYNVFVNMQYRGLYNVVERMDKDFFEAYFPDLGKDAWIVVKTGDDVLDGGVAGSRAWAELGTFFRVNADMRDDAVYREAQARIDVEDYTAYMILHIWAQNQDWPHNNWYAARPVEDGGRWIFLSWDSEFGMGRIPAGFSTDTLAHVMSRRDSSIGRIFAALITNVEYQKYFIAEVERHLEGALAAENVLARIEAVRALVAPDVVEEATLPSPSGGFPVSRWQSNVRTLETFARRRPDVLRTFVFRSPYITLPRVLTVSPNRVTLDGAEAEVTVGGRGLSDASRVLFNGVPSPLMERVSSSRYRVIVPFDLRVEGEPVIRLDSPAAEESLPAHGLLEVSFVRPRLLALWPMEGSVLGGDPVLINGANFGADLRVEFGGVPATAVEAIGDDRTAVRVVTPPGVAGVTTVRVVNQRPRDLPSEDVLEFTYVAAGDVFRRGDVTGDGSIGLDDGVAGLRFLFTGVGGASCLDALDTDDSGGVDIADAVYLLNYLFRAGSPAPPPPFESCGTDVTADSLPCAAQSGCA